MVNFKRQRILVCSLEELMQYESYGWQGEFNHETIQCFLIYHKGNVHSYINRCPHTGVNLEWIPNQFLDSRKEYIQCTTHGALFKIENGHCLFGPCVGDRLKMVENEVVDEEIYLIFQGNT